MIRVHVQNDKQSQQFEHDSGPLEFGRGPQQKHRRFVVEDVFFSRDQLRIEELSGGRVRLDNLSQKNAMVLGGSKALVVGTRVDADLPICLTLGKTRIELAGAA